MAFISTAAATRNMWPGPARKRRAFIPARSGQLIVLPDRGPPVRLLTLSLIREERADFGAIARAGKISVEQRAARSASRPLRRDLAGLRRAPAGAHRQRDG